MSTPSLLRYLCIIACLMLTVVAISRSIGAAEPNVVWIEAESFDDVGSWSRDTQHVDVMGLRLSARDRSW